MKCSVCGTQNPPDARYCRRCSAALPRAAEVEFEQEGTRGEGHSTAPLSDLRGTRPFDDDVLLEPEVLPTTDTQATQPLPRQRFFFEALPVGALVGSVPYEIVSLDRNDHMVNDYTARARRLAITCRSCAYSHNIFGDEYCQQCGAVLSDIEPHYLRYILKESPAPDAIAIERRLADMRLHHGGVLFPIDTFSESIANTRRYYVVMPEPTDVPGATLSAPQELTDVLVWGVMLAESLAFLHARNIVFGAADFSHVTFTNDMARWFDFGSARIVEAGASDRELFKQDVDMLAASLFVLLTGQIYTPQAKLPSASLSKTFADVFSGKVTDASTFAERLRGAFSEVRRPASYDLHVGRLTDIGQLRQLNEDSLLTLEAGYVHRSASRPLGLYVVADGAGGHAAGDVASGIVVRTLAQHAARTLFSEPLDEVTPGAFDVSGWLGQAVQLCNEAVHEQRNNAHTDMGTTLVMAVVMAGEAYIAHVGDSRAYVINTDGIKQITVDHSWVQRMVDTGQITPEEARTHERRNVIYKMIGDRPKVDADLNQVTLAWGDYLLLCSDGLSGPLEDAEMQRIVTSSSSPQDACRRLIDAANHAGGPDNISVVVVGFERIGEEK